MSNQDLTEKEFKDFQNFIYKVSGIRVQDSKLTLLSNRIRRCLKAGNFPDYQAYYKFLNSPSGKEEIDGLLDAVTTNETFFFRTEKHFEWFETEFLNDMILRARNGEHPKNIRVWSAACSTGEEPFTLAICLTQNQLRLKDWKLEIVGTDISEQVLETANKGVYKERTMELLTENQKRRHFKPLKEDDKLFQIQPHIQEMVSFKLHNLMEPFRVPLFDCIFIRNVLIYFDRESKQKVIENLVKAMAKGSYLVVGPSEGIFDMLGMLEKKSTFLYQK